MSDCSTPPSPSSVQNDARQNYNMLQNSTHPPHPMQVIRGPDGLLYAFAPLASASPNTTTASDYALGSLLPRLNPPGMQTIFPQSFSFPTSTALAAAAVVATGGHINIGALAAAATLQGTSPATNFPFVPIYAPFSSPTSLSQGSGVSLHPFPLSVPGLSAESCTQEGRLAHQQEAKSNKTSVSIQCLLAPGEAKLNEKQSKRSRLMSSASPEPASPCHLSSVTPTEHSFGLLGTNPNTPVMSVNKELISPTMKSSTVPAVNLTQEPAVLHDRQSSPQENRLRLGTSRPSSSASTSELSSSGLIAATGPHSVKSLSSLSRYVNQVATVQKQPPAVAKTGAGAFSLEKLLKPIHKAKEPSTPADSVEESKRSLSNHLAGEPHLMQFYDLFSRSHLSEHLRIRVLATDGGTSVLKWVEVTRSASHMEPDFGPLDAARILISSNGLCKLQLLFPYAKTLSTRFVPTTMVQANELFNELSPRHVICPGLPDCEEKLNALGYQPTNVRVVETPGLRRYDHDKCPIWHIPLPCNLYSESGQIVHHMCKQCKNLLSTLNKTITKITSLNTSAALSQELSDQTTTMHAMQASSLGSGHALPYLNRSPTGKVMLGQGGAKEGHGRKRKRRGQQPKGKESPVAVEGSKKIEFPGIYQLLQTAAGCELPQTGTAMTRVDNKSTPARSTYVAASNSNESGPSVSPCLSVAHSSSAIVDSKDGSELASAETSMDVTLTSQKTRTFDDATEAELDKDSES